jgi:hypothetical protein
MSLGCEGQAQNLTTRTTGCLGSGGNFSLFALGDAPLQGCPAGENQVSLRLDDLSDGAATVPFFVTLRFGEEQVIAQNGALELRARCILGSGSGDSLQLVVRSTLDGWLATSAGKSTTTQNLAQDEIVLFTAAGQPGQGRLSGFGDERLTGAQLALAPDGSFLAVALGSTALGVGLFDQDCLAVGTASLIRGVLPGAPRIPPERWRRATRSSARWAATASRSESRSAIPCQAHRLPACRRSAVGSRHRSAAAFRPLPARRRCQTAAFRHWAAVFHPSAARRRCQTAAFRRSAVAFRPSAAPRRCQTAASRH